MSAISRIVPCLWFDSQAEAAANFYVSIFKNSKIHRISRYGETGKEIHQRPPGSVMTVEFELDGQMFTALNGGPLFKFSEAVSFQIMVDDQKEVDFYWEKLTEGGQEQPCGWLRDKFGLSWQVVPTVMTEAFADHTSEEYRRGMEAMFKMKKPIIEDFKRAVEGAGMRGR